VTEAAARPEVSLAPRRWGLGDVALGFVVGQLGGLFLTVVLLSATGRSLDDVDDLPLALVALSQAGLWIGLLGAPLVATRLKGNGLVRDLGLRARGADAWGFLVGVLTQLLLLPLVYLPVFWLFDVSTRDLEAPARELTDRADDPVGVVLLVLIVGIGAPVIEEIFYRGLLQRSLLKRGMQPAVAVVITAVVFALSHQQLLQLPGLLVAGLVFGALAQRAGRLGPAIAAHIAFNLVTVVALLST
jgi:uncharacterized protein